MSKIDKWFSGKFHFDSEINTYMPFDFPILMRLFNTEGIKHFDNIDHFNLATLFVANYVINADGKRKRKEISFIFSFFKNHFSEEKAKSATYMLNKYANFPYDSTFYFSMIGDINASLNTAQKEHFIYFLFELADADGEICHEELNEIFKVCFKIGMTRKDMNRISALYISGYIPFKEYSSGAYYKKYGAQNTRNRKKKTSHKKSTSRRIRRPSTSQLTISLQILGLNLNASIPQIKAAYRTLAKRNHPDRFINLGALHLQKATEKMARINRAYEYIQRVRRFS